jgi:hypothetical protein
MNLAGLFRATERNAQEAPQQAPEPEQLIEPQAGPLAHLTARLMASMERRVSLMGEPVQHLTRPRVHILTSPHVHM